MDQDHITLLSRKKWIHEAYTRLALLEKIREICLQVDVCLCICVCIRKLLEEGASVPTADTVESKEEKGVWNFHFIYFSVLWFFKTTLLKQTEHSLGRWWKTAQSLCIVPPGNSRETLKQALLLQGAHEASEADMYSETGHSMTGEPTKPEEDPG